MDIRKVEGMNLVEIDALRIDKTIDCYFHWKQLDSELRGLSTRGLNFPSEISENLACYALGYYLNKSSGGDAYDPVKDKIIEMKASSSNEDTAPSSFSPNENFDELVFIKLNKYEDCIDIYLTGISSAELKTIKVNSTETVEDKQLKGQRPRFSIPNMIIKPRGLRPSLRFDMRRREIINQIN